MIQNCAPVYQACEEIMKHFEEEPGSDFGLVQQMEHEIIDSQYILDELQETEICVKNAIMANAFYIKVQKLCYNQDPICTTQAIKGNCDEGDDKVWMVENCAPACGTYDVYVNS
jgi:hypothetical protein